MTTTTPQDLPISGSMQPIEGFDAWMPLARSSYQRLADAFAAVPAERWADPTPCEAWTLRDLGGHMIGAMRSAASLREMMSQQRAIKRRIKETGEQEVEAMTAIQIERAADLSIAELVDELQALVPKASAGRQNMPGFVRRKAGFHVEMGDISERWNLDYFLSTILTRDAWLHRIDVADSLGAPFDLDDDDQAVVGDVAEEWARRHSKPVSLILTGPAGGNLVVGDGGPTIELDAIDFCRMVSGRKLPSHALLEQSVPF
ncbi:MAG: maleylpyruvate isomerase family mycothiol-dependent enzyme [Ilumatobacteraceae bacterium]